MWRARLSKHLTKYSGSTCKASAQCQWPVASAQSQCPPVPGAAALANPSWYLASLRVYEKGGEITTGALMPALITGCLLDVPWMAAEQESISALHFPTLLPSPSVEAQQERKRPGRGVVMWHIHHCSVRRDSGVAHKRFCLWNCLDCYKALRFVLPGCRSACKQGSA